jgi:XRE family transcriptional regulator, regulator of sulfur utilization
VPARGIIRSVGEVLRRRREERGLSQEALAHQAGVHRNVVGLIERGRYNPSILVLLALTTRLRMSLSELFSEAERRAG